MDQFYLDAIRKSEGFTPKAAWDYKQNSNGYGTRALYPGEVIDQAEAQRRFDAEIGQARAIVEKFAPNADMGTKAALTSLTFNAGDKWTRSGLGDAVRAGDMAKARELFLQYNKAGGEMLPGLASRRQLEAQWFGGSPSTQTAAAPSASPSEPQNALALAANVSQQTSPQNNVLDFIRSTRTAPIQIADNTGAAQKIVENYLRMVRT